MRNTRWLPICATIALLAGASAVWAVSSSPVTSTVSLSAYQGPGDVAAANGFAHRAWYGVRAYSAAKAGQALLNVCVSGVCSDMFSSGHGDLVPKTINNVPCPNTLGTCLIQKIYDLTGNGFDLIQMAPANQASLMSKALPILGNTRACIWFPDSGTNIAFYGSTATGAFAGTPVTFSGVMQNSAPGQRPSVSTFPQPAAFTDTNGHGMYFQQSTSFNVFSGNMFALWAGAPGNASAYEALAYDHVPHAIQATVPVSGNTTAYVDGVSNSSLVSGNSIASGGIVAMGSSAAAGAFIGVICEVGFTNADVSAANAAINANQTAYFLTAQQTLTPVQSFSQNFDSQPLGNVTIGQLPTLFPTPGGFYTHRGYVYVSGNTEGQTAGNPCTVQSNGNTQGGGPNSNCQLGSPPAFVITNSGQSGNGLQVAQPPGYFGGALFGFGTAVLVDFLGSPNSMNVLDVSWDEMISLGNSQPQGQCGGCGKMGILPNFQDSTTFDAYNSENLFYNTNPFSANHFIMGPDDTDRVACTVGTAGCQNSSFGGVTGGAIHTSFLFNSPTTSGNLSYGVWYHFHAQVALGPNGYYRFEITLPGQGPSSVTGAGQPIFDAYSRGAYTLGSFLTAQSYTVGYAAFAFAPHYGGQIADAPTVTSYINYDNIVFNAYQR